MVKKSETALTGMDEISSYLRRSSPTVRFLIRNMDFPAKKILGVWESDRQLIDEWRRTQIAQRKNRN